MKYDFTIVDVFTDRPFGGNQLAVLPHADGLSDEDMQAIAREFNFAETTFVHSAEDAFSAARLRIFSPGMEMPFAGHPTVGSAAVLVALGRGNPDDQGVTRLVFEEGVGRVRTEVRRLGDRFHSQLLLDSPVKLSLDAPPTHEKLARVLNVDEDDIVEAWAASMGIPFSFCRLRNRDVVDHATLNSTCWKAEFQSTWAEAIFFFSGDLSHGAEVYARMFHPAAGIAEDPATGSAAAALVSSIYVREAASGNYSLLVKQGYKMGRPSHIEATVMNPSGTEATISVGGSVVEVARGQIQI